MLLLLELQGLKLLQALSCCMQLHPNVNFELLQLLQRHAVQVTCLCSLGNRLLLLSQRLYVGKPAHWINLFCILHMLGVVQRMRFTSLFR